MRHLPGAILQRQSLSLKAKVSIARRRIREWHAHWDGDVYVAFSGGRDSTVLLHLVRELYPEVPAVFFDTGLEFPEIRQFVKTFSNVEWIKPKFTFREVIERYGYPVVSKRMAQYIHEVQRSRSETATKHLRLTGYKTDGTFSKMGKISNKWLPLALQTDFPVSDRCCFALKKRPAYAYEKRTGRKAIIGTMAVESQQRTLQWNMDGCNAFEAKRPTSKPLSVWTTADITAYLKGVNSSGKALPYSTIYDRGYTRTGCVFCMFGVHIEHREGLRDGLAEPNRFLRLEVTHPKLHAYCFKAWDKGGLGMAPVMDFIKIPWTASAPG